MKVLTEPKVTLIAKQIFIEHPDYPIPLDGDDATKIGSFAAKCCYDSVGREGRANEANQRQVLEHEHGSVLEHVTFTLFIEGITRGLSLESNRHRPLAVSQRSTRYTAEEDAAIVLEPYYAHLYKKYELGDDLSTRPYVDTVDGYDPAEIHLIVNFIDNCDYAICKYELQVEELEALNPLGLKGFDLRKWARGKARNLLPHGLETRITYTGNVRAWRWFIEARSDKHAEPEIRRLADVVLQTLRAASPLYFEDFEQTEIYDGIPVWTPKFSKV